jgi:uncharacterized glyoxalase superfamily protein PhnB
MTNEELWNAPDVVPSLAYDDVAAAVDWLTRVFGFRERSDARLSWAGGAMAWMEVGDGLINLSTSGGHELRSPLAAGELSQALKVYVDDIDRHFERARAEGATIVSVPEDGFWARIYRVKDLEGHLWRSQRGRDLVQGQEAPPGIKRGGSVQAPLCTTTAPLRRVGHLIWIRWRLGRRSTQPARPGAASSPGPRMLPTELECITVLIPLL